MSLSSESVTLYVGKDCYNAEASMDVTIGELVDACHSGTCPMGLFSCPLLQHFDCQCDKVTAKMWGYAFGLFYEQEAQA